MLLCTINNLSDINIYNVMTIICVSCDCENLHVNAKNDIEKETCIHMIE